MYSIVYFVNLFLQVIVVIARDEPQVVSLRHETDRSIILAKGQAVFCPGRKHPVRFINTSCDKVIDHDSHIGLRAIKDERGSTLYSKRRVYAGP